jgi:DNA replication protein DnaC
LNRSVVPGGGSQRRHVAFWPATDLVRALIQARDNRELTRPQRAPAASTMPIVDELGLVPFERVGGELLSNFVADR